MTTQRNRQRMTDACSKARADVASLVGWFASHLDSQGDGKLITWEAVESLQQVRRSLIETLAFFEGVEEPEIERSLEQMRD
jgi:hypothetical protein